MDGYVGSWTFVAEYCGYIILAITGLMQLVAARWRLRGMAFFRNARWCYAFGIIAIAGAFTWFYGFTGIDLTEPTFDTPPQLLWFAVSVAAALLLTLGVSSVINRRMNDADDFVDPDERGIDVLRRMTYWSAVSRNFDRGRPK
jgi:hypothetical protein